MKKTKSNKVIINPFDIEEFIKLHKNFTEHKTWTKLKKAAHENLTNYINSSSGKIKIITNRDSKTKKVHFTNHFTIFKVTPKQKGYLIPYREKFVMMFCQSRDAYRHYLIVFPISMDENQILKIIEDQKLLNYEHYVFIEF